MKQENNNVPLYKRLNEIRTQGEWDCGYGDSSRAYGIFTKKMLEEGLSESPVCLVSPMDKMDETDIANAQYIILSANHFAQLAGVLEAIINCAFTNSSNTVEIGKAELKAAKEALKAIS